MTYNYPFFSFPHFRRSNSNYYNNKFSTPIINNLYSPINNATYSNLKNFHINNNFSHKGEKKASSNNFTSSFSFLNNLLYQDDRKEDEPFLKIFGIKLYYDDILLISLIFFLYKEDVKDQYLLFALILLLLS